MTAPFALSAGGQEGIEFRAVGFTRAIADGCVAGPEGDSLGGLGYSGL